MCSKHLLYVLLCVVLSAAGCNFSINKSIYVDDGDTRRGSLNTVNGSIMVGRDCVIRGECRSVNGRVEIGRDSKVEDVQAVNGELRIRNNVEVRGDAESVNGNITCYNGVEIKGSINTVNGDVDCEGTNVRRNITTYNGDITLLDKSIIRGDIIVKRTRERSDHRRRLDIEIAEESEVYGDIIVKDDDIEVRVYLSGDGRVHGRIEGAEVIK